MSKFIGIHPMSLTSVLYPSNLPCMNIDTLITLEESKTLEFKENLDSKDRLLASVIALANTSGGKIVIGVQDKTKNIVGVQNPYAEEERLVSMICDSIAPFLLPSIETLAWRDTHILLIDVPLSQSRPHYLANKGPEKSIYVRVGSTNRLADIHMIQSIKRSTSGGSYDEEPYVNAEVGDLDRSAIIEAFQQFRTIETRDLLSLGVLTKIQGKTCPTIGGLLFFGKNKQRFFPDAFLQAGYFQGTSKSVILDSQNIDAHFHETVQQALNFARRNLRVGLRIEGVTHEEHWEIPQVALREALLNALIHTDYSLRGSPIRMAIFDDRIEIENPGLLPYGLSIEDIKSGFSKLRNRTIARVFRELKKTEQWGSGIRRIIESCIEAGLEVPVFEEVSSDRFRVTLYRKRVMPVYLDETEKRILDFLEKEGPHSTKYIAQHIALTERNTRRHLAKLVKKGKLQTIGRSQKDPQKKYIFLS